MKPDDTWTGKRVVEAMTPRMKNSGGGRTLTPRDFSNVGLSGSCAVIAAWFAHDVLGLEMSPEVAVAFGTLGGYAVGRLLMY